MISVISGNSWHFCRLKMHKMQGNHFSVRRKNAVVELNQIFFSLEKVYQKDFIHLSKRILINVIYV